MPLLTYSLLLTITNYEVSITLSRMHITHYSNGTTKQPVTMTILLSLVKGERVKVENPNGLKFEASIANPFEFFGYKIPYT